MGGPPGGRIGAPPAFGRGGGTFGGPPIGAAACDLLGGGPLLVCVALHLEEVLEGCCLHSGVILLAVRDWEAALHLAPGKLHSADQDQEVEPQVVQDLAAVYPVVLAPQLVWGHQAESGVVSVPSQG